jgi:hypothetical protein
MRMPRLTLLALSVVLIFGALVRPTMAQETPTSPPPGRAERKAIVDTIRAGGDLHNIVFIVRYLKVQRGWAFVTVDPKTPDGEGGYQLGGF